MQESVWNKNTEYRNKLKERIKKANGFEEDYYKKMIREKE